MLCILEKISPSELVSNGYISNHNKVRRPRPKFKNSFYLYFCCFWINVTQINFENIKIKVQRIISDSCFHLKSWFIFILERPLSHYWTSPLRNFIYHWKKLEPLKETGALPVTHQVNNDNLPIEGINQTVAYCSIERGRYFYEPPYIGDRSKKGILKKELSMSYNVLQ